MLNVAVTAGTAIGLKGNGAAALVNVTGSQVAAATAANIGVDGGTGTASAAVAINDGVGLTSATITGKNGSQLTHLLSRIDFSCRVVYMFLWLNRHLAHDARRQAAMISGFSKGVSMTKVTIDNQDYDLESLSDEVKGQLSSLQFVDAELVRLNAQTAVLQTARMAYANALKATLPSPFAGDTLKFN